MMCLGCYSRSGDLERIGDHAVNIAARTLYANDSDRKLIY